MLLEALRLQASIKAGLCIGMSGVSTCCQLWFHILSCRTDHSFSSLSTRTATQTAIYAQNHERESLHCPCTVATQHDFVGSLSVFSCTVAGLNVVAFILVSQLRRD